VVGIELNHKPRTQVKKGDPSVAIRVESPNYATPATYGRHFTQDNEIYAHVITNNVDYPSIY
jgi:translation initiation factor 5B